MYSGRRTVDYMQCAAHCRKPEEAHGQISICYIILRVRDPMVTWHYLKYNSPFLYFKKISSLSI